MACLSTDAFIPTDNKFNDVFGNVLWDAFIAFHHMLKVYWCEILLPYCPTQYQELLRDIFKLGEDCIVCE